MKERLIRLHAKLALTAIALLIGAGHATAADNHAQIKAREEVERSVHEMVAAYANNEVDKYFSYYGDDLLVCCNQGEPWSKQAYYSYWKQAVGKGGGMAKAEVTRLEIRASQDGHTAVVFFQMPSVRRMPAAGQDPNVTFNMTETWMKDGGRWHVKGIAFSLAAND
jgi:ketosteroid isomerase-like protein